MLTTHRLIQLHNLADDLSSRARVCLRGAANLERIGNKRGAQYQRAKGLRFQVIAEKAVRRAEGMAMDDVTVVILAWLALMAWIARLASK